MVIGYLVGFGVGGCGVEVQCVHFGIFCCGVGFISCCLVAC